jgi:TolB-like protein/class 3 adenylate cyclase/tetratricopeptide (TPR) repeat protein
MGAITTERRLAAILAADVVGYSRLVERDEAATLTALRKLRGEVIDPLLARHKGRIVKLMGDGIIAEFGSVVDAVACAVALQKQTAAAQSETPADRRIIFRIGVNLGDMAVEGDDLLGDGVNVAARLEQLCDPGSILISGTAYDHLQGKLDLPLDFAGEQQVKNIARPVRAYRVRLYGSGLPWRLRLRQHRRGIVRAAAVLIALALVGGGVWWFRPVNSAAASTSIAVLPFDNLGGDEQTGRLADGITEDIITDLARFREIEVIARNSVEVYKDNAVDIRQVGRDLNVRYVLEGSIQRQGDRFRITAQLIEAASGTHVWSDRWERPAADVFAVQTELSTHVSAKLAGGTGIVLAAGEQAALRKRPTDLGAYDLYLLGSAAFRRETKESIDEAVRLLEQSVEIDPAFARGWTRLSLAYMAQSDWFDDNFQVEGEQLRLEAAQRAVRLDPQDAEAHSALAIMLALTGDFAQSEVEFETALNLNPNSADILTAYGQWASNFGKPEKGVELAERAIRLNPNLPVAANHAYRSVYFYAGRYEDALRFHLRRPMQGIGDYVYGAMIYAELGRLDEARATVAKTLAIYPDVTIEFRTGHPGYSDWERQRLIPSMRKAGFPVCASQAVLQLNPDLVRMPECLEAQAAN